MNVQMSSYTAVLASAFVIIAGAGNGQTQGNQQYSATQIGAGQNFYITTPQTGERTSAGSGQQATANTYLAQTTWQRPASGASQTQANVSRQQQQAYSVQQVANNASQHSVQQATANYYANQGAQATATNYYTNGATAAVTSANQQSAQQTFYPAAYVSNASTEKKSLLSRLTGRKSQPAATTTHQHRSPVQAVKGAALKTSKYAGTLQRGVASWYGGKWHGRKTASGERYNQQSMTAAHKTLPFGTVVKVTNERNGQECTVRINNRGPFTKGRILDLSKAAAQKLGMVNSGVAKVRMEVVGRS